MTIMEKIKNALLNNFEGCLIFITFTSIIFVNYLVYQKMSFLNFYYLGAFSWLLSQQESCC